MTITCSPPFVVCVSTVCWGVLFRLPAAWLCLRSRWMLSNTAPRSTAKAPPSCEVQVRLPAIRSTTCGKGASATKLGSKPACSAAFCSSLPLSVDFCFSHALSSPTLRALPEQSSICASSWSG